MLDALERECLRVRAMETEAAAPHRRPTKHQQEDKGAENKNGTFKRGTNSAPYRLSKLKRDHPEVAKRVEAGEFKKVADAERAPAKWLTPLFVQWVTKRGDIHQARVLSDIRHETGFHQNAS